MCGIVVQTTSALCAFASPRRALGFQHHGPIRLSLHVSNPPDGIGFQEPLGLTKSAHETVVVTDLCDKAAQSGHTRELGGFGRSESEGFLAKNMKTALKSRAHHRRMKARGSSDQHRIEFNAVEHLFEIRERLQACVLREHAQNVPRRVHDSVDRDIRMRANHRQMRQPHLAQANDP